MGYLKKHTLEILAAIGIIILYFFTRLITINFLPIFTDEAIYMRWAQIASHDASWRFISLTDGKQPLFVWLTMFVMHYVHDPLLPGRLVSVIGGFFTMIGLFFLGKETFKNRYIGVLSAFLYVVYPFALVYDRMALYDTLVGTFTVWGLYLTILFIRHLRLDLAMIFGIEAGIGALNKSNAFFVIYLLPFSLILFDWRKKNLKERFLKFVGLSIVSVVLVYGIYDILRLSPFFYIIDQKNAIFIYPFSEWIHHPFTFFWGNLWIGQRDWFVKYFSYPFILLVFVSLFINRQYLREKLLLGIWFAAPFVALALFGRTLYPRYILFMTLSLLPLVAFALYYLGKKLKSPLLIALLIAVAIIVPVIKDYYILFDFGNAPIPISDVTQYYTDWPSGLGVKESIQYLRDTEQGKKVALFTEGTFGLMPDVYNLYLYNDNQFVIKGLWPITDTVPQSLYDSAKKLPTYIAFYQPCSNCEMKGRAPIGWNLPIAYQYKKPAGNTWFTLYKVEPR